VAAAAGVGAIEHRFRPTIYSQEQRFVLDGDTLHWHDGRQEQSTLLSQIVGIRVFAVPSGMGPPVRTAVLKLRSGQKLTLRGSSYVRFGVMEDVGATYRAIVEELVLRVAASNPGVPVIVGPPTSIWIFWLTTLIGALLLLLIGAWVLVSGEFPWQAAMALWVVIFFLPRLWRGVVGNRAHRVDPTHLPPTLFSSVS
jgi:hypothetical protein